MLQKPKQLPTSTSTSASISISVSLQYLGGLSGACASSSTVRSASSQISSAGWPDRSSSRFLGKRLRVHSYGCFYALEVLYVGVLVIRTLLFVVYTIFGSSAKGSRFL